jgi:N,N'-diacetyllegionaminate synthase
VVRPLDIAGRLVGPGQPCLVIAEAGVNHNGSLERALAMVDAAAQAGADAIKFQTFRAEEVVTEQAPKAAYQKQTTDADQSQLAMLKSLEISPSDHQALVERCKQRNVIFLSTPFDLPSLDLLASLGLPAYKIPSGEVTNLPFLSRVGAMGRPVILSTGMSNMGEVDTAVRELQKAGCHELALLHCVSNYPAEPSDVNLRAMSTLADKFQMPVGFSDHTLGNEIALAAVALGACIIEKHFTLDRSLPGPDQRSSIEPDELAALVAGIQKVEAALGHGRKESAHSEGNTKAVARRSLVAARDIAAGEVISEELVAIKRPGTGLAPSRLEEVLGMKVKRDIPVGTLLSMEMLN